MITENKKLSDQNHKCFYCNCNLIPRFPNQKGHLDDNPTRDHIITKSSMKQSKIDLKNNGGLPHNTVISCHGCNNQRGNRPFLEFYLEKKWYLFN